MHSPIRMLAVAIALLLGWASVRGDAPRFPAAPETVNSLGAIACDGWLYTYGGHKGKVHEYSTETASGKLHRLNLSDPKKWEELPGGAGLQGMNLAAWNGKVYIAGGMQPRNKPGEPADLVSVADCRCFDPATKKWTDLPALPEPRSSHDAVVVGSKLYLVGGWNMQGAGKPSLWLKTVHVIDLASKAPKWETIAAPFERRALAAAALDGKIYVLGGLTKDGGTTRQVDVLDAAAGTWSQAPKYPGSERNGFSPAACAMNGKLYLAVSDGGVYCLNGKAWDLAGSVERGRIVARMVPANGSLLIIGGSTSTGLTNEIAVVTPKVSATGGGE